jgi:SAM-dependent methyltransferase
VFAPGGPTLLELWRQAWSSTDRGYDLLAPKFDHTPFRTPTLLLDAARPFVAGLPPIDRALDLCCGTGAGMELLQPFARQVWGVDRSEGMLTFGHAKLAAHENLRWIRGDALALPFAGTFDLITCFGAFGHVLEADEPRLVAEVHAALRPGGRFLFYTSEAPSPVSPGFWLAHGFNAAMRLRNRVRKPEFVMYYLTFLLPRAQALLEAAGFQVEVLAPALPEKLRPLKLVIATRPV